MTFLINVGRAAMGIWVLYSMVLILAPSWVHHAPDLKSGFIQFLVAYMVGYSLDRLLGVVRKRKAALDAAASASVVAEPAQTSIESTGVI